MTHTQQGRGGFAGGMGLSVLKAAAACLMGLASMHALADDDAGSLRQKYGDLRTELRNNAFNRPLYMESAQGDGSLQGDVYAVLDHPFSKVSQSMKEPARWCDIMMLPFSTKSCRAGQGANASRLEVRIGRKADQPVEQAYKLNFDYRNVAASSDYFDSRLNAPSGPLGTRDYRINMTAIPIDGNRTFMHLSYAYGYGSAGQFAMQAYLATVGAKKVGFSSTGRDANGQPQYVNGVRGAIERNAMRYYLAIDAYLEALDAPPAQQVDKRIQAWINGVERYPRQLHEMEPGAYVAMKRQEYQQQTAALQ
ncbi:hypothetical protein [Ramlibacter sp.]|uniref:hypothetical protein n=1 Tax=Ramlibacter sp. TaxID=1917967 RepID=UPI0025E79BCB|nr:hypothetical protein [Ramlibacter sp.]